MRKHYHLPSAVTIADDLPALERERLTAVVLDAVARAVHPAALAGSTVTATPGRPPAREPFAGLRVTADGSAYATPSYDDGGRPVGVPLRSRSFPFRVRLDRRLDSAELLREFVRQYRHVAGAEAARLLDAEHWHWTGTPPEVTDADLARRYKVLHVVDHSLRLAHAAQQAANEQALAVLGAGQRDELNAEVDRRFRAATGRTGQLGSGQEDRELAAYWLGVRDELLRERREIDALPPRIRDFLFTEGAPRAAGPADYAAVLRLAHKLAGLTDAELAGYPAKVDAHTTDWRRFEASVDRYLAQVARFREAGVTVESAKTALFEMDGLYELYKVWRAVGGMSGTYAAVDETRAHAIDAEFRAALAKHGLASPAAFEGLVSDFLAAFEDKTVLIGLELLDGYDRLLSLEQQRLEAPGAADRLVAALAGTRAKALYAEAEEKAGTARAIGPDPELHRYLGDDYARKTRLAAEAARAKAAADELVTAAAAGPLAAEEGFDRAALAQAASAAEVLRVVRTYVTRHRNGVAATSAELKADRAFGYDLPPLHELSLRLQDIREGTLYFRIVEDRLKSRQARKSVTAIVLAVVTLAISVATAGTGTVALLGALAVFGLGAWQAVEAYQEYRRGHGAHLAGLVQDDPWFGWVLVAVAGAGIDLAGAAAAIRPAEPALRLAKTTGDAARLAADLKAAGISERLAAGIVAQFRGAVGLDAALRDLAAAAGGVNSAIGGVRGIGPMVRAAYYGIRQGIVSLDRFVLRLRAARLLAEGELSAGELIRLRAAFEQAGTAGRRIRTLGTELGLSEEQLSAVVDSWGANPAWTLAEVEGRLRAVATGNVRAAYESVLANRPVLDRELSTVEQRIAAAAGRPNPADLARWDELTARLSRLREIDSVSVAPRGGRIVEVSLDEAAPNFFETVAPVVPDPPVVLEFPDGTRVWRTAAGGPVRHESTLGGSLGRAGMERGMYSAGQHGNLPSGPSYERAHTLGQGTGFESPYGIFYAPEFVNQRLQNEGIEAYLRTVAAGAHPGETFRVFTKVRPHPDTLRLATIDYRLVRVDQAGAEEVASYSIVVSSSAEHPVVTAGALRFAPTSTGRAMATRFPIPPQLTTDARFAY